MLAGIGGGAIIFENETMLSFSRQFLSVSISTSRAIYTGGMTINIRAIMLTTALQPYTGIADLFIIDPDGYTIRKWNSKELNVGVLYGEFVLPEYPKVGFWKVKVEAQGQVNEKAFKVEKYYDPKFEVYVRMPTFVLDTDKYIEADVSGYYPFEKTVRGDIQLRWFAKKVDYTTPLYNDSVLYREEHSYYYNISNTYRSNLYNSRDGIPLRNISLISKPSRYGYFDPYVVRTHSLQKDPFACKRLLTVFNHIYRIARLLLVFRFSKNGPTLGQIVETSASFMKRQILSFCTCLKFKMQ